jgi:hypothetical protein
MKCLKNTLKIEAEVWDDPGDYPNSIASRALPSYSYLTCDGELILEFEENDGSIDEFIEYFNDWICCGKEADSIGAYVYVPGHWYPDWQFNVEGNKITVTVGEDSKESLE